MELWHTIVYGFVEGTTEFLPISSTGHLMMTTKLLGIPDTAFVKSFEIAIQLGAILAVVFLYPRKLLRTRETMVRIVAAFIPTAILGLLLYKVVKNYLLDNVTIVIGALFFGGIVMIFIERHFKISAKTRAIQELSIRESIAIGTIQALAFIPGVSRAAATIFGGMWIGLRRSEAVEFSFLLAVPTMSAATALDLIKNYHLFTREHTLFLLTGFIVSFAVALCTIKVLVRFVAGHDFTLFGYYRIIIALLFFIVFF